MATSGDKAFATILVKKGGRRAASTAGQRGPSGAATIGVDYGRRLRGGAKASPVRQRKVPFLPAVSGVG